MISPPRIRRHRTLKSWAAPLLMIIVFAALMVASHAGWHGK